MCSEIHVINFLVNEVDSDNYIITKEVFKEIADSIVDNNKAMALFSSSFIEKYKKKCMYYGSSIIGKDKATILRHLLRKECYQTWDNYSLSCIFLNFIQHAFKNEFPDSDFLIKFSQILCVNISPDPEDRFTIEQTIKHTNSLIQNLDINDLTSLAGSLHINSKYMVIYIIVLYRFYPSPNLNRPTATVSRNSAQACAQASASASASASAHPPSPRHPAVRPPCPATVPSLRACESGVRLRVCNAPFRGLQFEG